MGEICIPIPSVRSGEKTDISVISTGAVQQYKLEVFMCSKTDGNAENTMEEVFITLKNKIENYDKSWELLQVYAPEGENHEVKVLFRKR